MMITVSPCFHWVGYHISTGLLQEGYEVIGIDGMDDLLSDHLYMYVGRNSNFQHFYNHTDKENHLQIGEEERKVSIDDYLIVILSGEGSSLVRRIEIPELYGEWMDIHSLNLQSPDELYEWVIKNDAVYITDFLKVMIPLIIEEKAQTSTVIFDQEKSDEDRKRNVEAVWKSHMVSLSLGII
ncbi:hypothetical protein [Halobacillus sp. BBL2006]|uniref:hypothetical protein n=1 Tax=Halobacillus sp. BBL2006 TaxID=1543706 RepID=UPI00054452B9|nr:hypothetical protein [Halobacillus sp. BBL2006]KHE69462.1 hypothetical protein LD39_12835 [Halobacillus sp. BBL2006]